LHDTFGRLFSLLEAETVQCAIQLWLTNIMVLNPKEVVAIDGKHVRRSHDQWQGQPTLQVVNAWASESRLMLAQVKVEEDSNEITAVPRLLEQLMLTGCIVTLDAMGTQTEIASQIVKGGADYILPVKDNQPALAERVRDLFAFADELAFEQVAHTYAETVTKRHGRIETRRCWVLTQPDFIESLPRRAEWESLHTIVRLVSTRCIADHSTTCERFFTTSLTDDATVVLPAIRAH
jgi:predicted transposase YbfD/YdcC